MSSSSRNHSSPMQAKDHVKNQAADTKMSSTSTHSATAVVKPAANVIKVAIKSSGKEMPVSPTAPAPDRAELLGSLTTQQQQRTSARVIKKLRLDDAADRDKRDIPECETQKLKEEEKETLKLITGKQRMPKALWSSDEKDLFFEALNEYGKDFDAITAYICAKMKKKGISSANLKTKSQVSHFYYRTWHKLSKQVHFDENVKKVAQELYALINYGELRKKLSSVQEKVCTRLHELVARGVLAVRARGRTLRVRTPACRALRKLNQLTERGWEAGVCGRCTVTLRARDSAAWARAVAAAHNPRLQADLPLRATLRDVIAALQRRWQGKKLKREKLCEIKDPEVEDNAEDDEERMENHLNLETDQLIVQESKLPKRLSLHVGPPPAVEVHVPVLVASEHLSSQNICFQSYLERVRDKDPSFNSQTKLRTPKRHRKDSTTDKDTDSGAPKKFKPEEGGGGGVLDLDDTAVDNVHLVASYRNHQEEHPSTEDEKLELNEEVDIEKDSLSELEDDDKDNNYSDGDSDGKKPADKFSNLKVKFRIRSKKRGGSIYTLITDFPKEESPERNTIIDIHKTSEDCKTPDEKPDKTEEEPTTPEPEKIAKIPDDLKITEIVKNEDQIKVVDQEKLNDQIKAEKDQFKVTNDAVKVINDQGKVNDQVKVEKDQIKTTNSNDSIKLAIEQKVEIRSDEKVLDDVKDDEKSDIDEEYVKRQIRKGWSVGDAGDLTIGDLYLMFGSRSKLELDYWWAEPSPPLPPPPPAQTQKLSPATDCRIEKNKVDKTPEKGTDSSLEDDKEKRESDTDIFSPKNVYGQDSNDGMSGDERKDQISVSDLKAASGTLRVSSKLVNRPEPADNQARLAHMTDRLKRLLSMAGNPLVGAAEPPRCGCGHVCPTKRRPSEIQIKPLITATVGSNMAAGAGQGAGAESAPAHVFRHPTPIAPKPDNEIRTALSAGELPPRRRGRGGARGAERRVVVQRLLPLLPKLPAAASAGELIPVKLMPSPPQLPRLLPKPAPSGIPEGHTLYILSESNGQFFFHDGDQKIPISQEAVDTGTQETEEVDSTQDLKQEAVRHNIENADIATFLPSESGSAESLSASRLLAEGGWLEGADFSLSSFLGRLDGRPPDISVDSQLQSLMAESSVDYVAKFADLAAEVAGGPAPGGDAPSS